MPGVFTIFNHGTNASRDGDGEIVAEFGRLALGTEYRDFLICDGPGSNPTSSVTPGRFNPFTRDKQAKTTFGNAEMGNTHINWKLTGTLTGAGWDDNVIHAIATIAELDPAPTTINMLGWSRGAVTCTKMAFRLREIFPQIPVNIFAVDPVAGIGNKGDEDASTIRGNVRNYLAVLSMHETRGFFKPQDIKRVTFTNRGTNAIYLPFPGNHGGQVNLDKSVKKNLGESAAIGVVSRDDVSAAFRNRVHVAAVPSLRRPGTVQPVCEDDAEDARLQEEQSGRDPGGSGWRKDGAIFSTTRSTST